MFNRTNPLLVFVLITWKTRLTLTLGVTWPEGVRGKWNRRRRGTKNRSPVKVRFRGPLEASHTESAVCSLPNAHRSITHPRLFDRWTVWQPEKGMDVRIFSLECNVDWSYSIAVRWLRSLESAKELLTIVWNWLSKLLLAWTVNKTRVFTISTKISPLFSS